jgi:predicted nucleotidyltransferase
MTTAKALADFFRRVTDWAARQPTIVGVALVGSHARGEARTDSDIDLVLLCTEPRGFLTETSWIHHFGEVEVYHTEDWGLVTSLRVYYRDGVEVEFGMTTLAWAALPVDPGTKHVVSHGMRILWDREGRLGRLQEAVAASYLSHNASSTIDVSL